MINEKQINMQTHALQTSTPSLSLSGSDKKHLAKELVRKKLLEIDQKLVCLITQIIIKHP